MEQRQSSFGQLLQGLSAKRQERNDADRDRDRDRDRDFDSSAASGHDNNTANDHDEYGFLRLASDGASIIVRLANPLTVDLCGLSDLQHVQALGGPGR